MTPPSPLAHAPDVTIPLRFMLVGLLSLLATVVLLLLNPDVLTSYHYNQRIVAITHLLVLGFALSIVHGAMYQLVPVALETTLHSERLARWHFPVHLVSVAGMVWMFWVWDMKQVGHFGSALALGIGFFVWNLIRTLRKVRGWTVVSFGIASTLFWLVAVILAGLVVATAKCTFERVDRPDLHPLLAAPLVGLQATATFLSRFEPLAVMHAHAHLGVLGVFVLLTASVGYKLIPMFMVADIANPRRAWASIVLLNLGIAAAFLAILLQHPLKPAAALLVIAGLTLYGFEMAAIVRARRRITIDWGLRAFLLSQALLAPTAALGLWLARPGLSLDETVGRLENAYGFLALFGVVAFAILAMLYKILPFLVWFVAYGAHVGRARTPALHTMFSTPVQITGLASWLAGLATVLAAILLAHTPLARVGSAILLASLVAFLINATRILSHLRNPQLVPIPTPTPPRRNATATPPATPPASLTSTSAPAAS